MGPDRFAERLSDAPNVRPQLAVNRKARYQVPCDLWVGAARETDQDFVQIEKLLDALKVAWARFNLSWTPSPLELHKNPIPVHYEIIVTALGC